ncbi:MAG: PA2778 family cysteine peptidase [Hydrogenophaga sp.]|uniref:PA2778 family cysteine peptidase n=1 Tax=Hydrogenophaga sp. TaxID=1904254 RepID=UPI002745AAE4|nr:PA2778 family cysteine peptidase [Hydrogenophaga sp.]MDP2418225.1 PA2778 family cysteine peptidase [Hydrogenophaga sp.]MDZ4190013.1 PA2778 family cysteine peptidase [Hydrogenophaga sp.]
MSVWRLRHATPALAGVLLCGLLLLGGCATPPQLTQLERQWPAQLPDRVLLEQVPFHPQDDNLCGPATLAMVAQAAGKSVTPEQLTPQVYLPGRQGALQLEMLAAARRQGLVAYPLAPTLQALLTEVASGHPVLVLQNLALPISPMWHYAVVVGFDRERREILLHSGTTALLAMPLSTFEHTWARSDHWAFRVSLPTQLPVTAQPDAWASAVAPLERVDAQAAEAAYTTALSAWPGHRISLLGLGNTAYALGRREDAARAFEATTRAHPDFADAWNNLAQVQLELGQLEAAHQAASKAVTLGGTRLTGYRALLDNIDARRR